jgi:hypothetical protein
MPDHTMPQHIIPHHIIPCHAIPYRYAECAMVDEFALTTSPTDYHESRPDWLDPKDADSAYLDAQAWDNVRSPSPSPSPSPLPSPVP